MRNKINSLYISLAACLLFSSGCKKMLAVDPPIDSLTTVELFADNVQAEWAVAGIYSTMINGLDSRIETRQAALKYFAAGASTIFGAFSADELTPGTQQNITQFYAAQNKLTLSNSGNTENIWESAFRTVYDANAALEGLEASTSILLTDSVKKQLIGETLVLRAFSYFYLVNFFGDVPLVLSTDFKKTMSYSRSPVVKIYDQIKADLVRARPLLSHNFSVGKNERVRVNRWVAEALLARVYLYTGEHQLAINSATELINQAGMFTIEQDLSKVFKSTSQEAIFQLRATNENTNFVNSTPESLILANPAAILGLGNVHFYQISNELMNAFEADDKRKINWIQTVSSGTLPAKHKYNVQNSYYTAIRLAEMYLIRAEATVLLTPSAKNNAVEDLNVLRRRAGVTELDDQLLSAEQVKEAIAHERQTELFLEWGHRWFDLKRTGKASAVLSAITNKQPWYGDYQLLYPIPDSEIKVNSNLHQNPEYNLR